MTGGYDEMSDRSYPRSIRAARRASAGTASCCGRAMEAEGFTVYEAEWWHFDYKDWQRYPVCNVTFDADLGRGRLSRGAKRRGMTEAKRRLGHSSQWGSRETGSAPR